MKQQLVNNVSIHEDEGELFSELGFADFFFGGGANTLRLLVFFLGVRETQD